MSIFEDDGCAPAFLMKYEVHLGSFGLNVPYHFIYFKTESLAFCVASCSDSGLDSLESSFLKCFLNSLNIFKTIFSVQGSMRRCSQVTSGKDPL